MKYRNFIKKTLLATLMIAPLALSTTTLVAYSSDESDTLPKKKMKKNQEESYSGNVDKEESKSARRGSSDSLDSKDEDSTVSKKSANKNAEGDAVSEAWDEFMKQKGNDGDREELSSGLTKSTQGFADGPWGTVFAAVFGGVGLAGAYAAKKHLPKMAGWSKKGANANEKVEVLSVSQLSQQGSIAVVKVRDEVLVLGVTAGRVSLLTHLNKNDALFGTISNSSSRASKKRAQADIQPIEHEEMFSEKMTEKMRATVQNVAQQAISNAMSSNTSNISNISNSSNNISSNPTGSKTSAKKSSDDDFDALLSNLMGESKKVSTALPSSSPLTSALASNSMMSDHEPTTPLAKYAALSDARRSISSDVATDDMAGQVLRKMKTMKKFRSV